MKSFDLSTWTKTPTKSIDPHSPMLNPKRTAMTTHTQAHHATTHTAPLVSPSQQFYHTLSIETAEQQPPTPPVVAEGSSKGGGFVYDSKEAKNFIKATYGGGDSSTVITSESSTTYPSSGAASKTGANIRALQMRSPRGFVFP